MAEQVGQILLTGPPGIGKTTLIRKVYEDLVNKHNIACSGFYTEEVRDPNTKQRIGFDVVTLNNKRAELARISCERKGPFVGKYCINVKDFEDIVLPLMKPTCAKSVLIIDEVGKMELKSIKFEMAVEACITKTTLLATVPHNVHRSLNLADKLKKHPKSQVILVTKDNRNCLQHEVTKEILKVIRNKTLH